MRSEFGKLEPYQAGQSVGLPQLQLLCEPGEVGSQPSGSACGLPSAAAVVSPILARALVFFATASNLSTRSCP